MAKAISIATSNDRQKVVLSNDETISARLVVIANGLNVGLRHMLGIERHVHSSCHSISIGFDIAPLGRKAFPFPALTYFSERPSDRIPYISLFPIGAAMRANLFVYRDFDDPWLREFRRAPVETLTAALPRLKPITGPFAVSGDVKIRPVDLCANTGYRRAGIVLVGDAFETTCPVSGTGTDKVFTDVERLCNVHIPEWLATDGMDESKIAAFYDDPVKRACDEWAMEKAYSFRAVSIDPDFYWALARWARFLTWFGRGLWRRQLERWHGGSLLFVVVIVLAVAVGLNGGMGRDALVVPELAIDAVLRQQLRMRAALDRLTARDHDDLVHVDHRGQAMGRPDHGAAPGDLEQRAVDRGFRGLVQRRGRLVEQQNGGIADDGARDRDALALTA